MKTKLQNLVASLLFVATPIASAALISETTVDFSDQQIFTSSGFRQVTLTNNNAKTETLWPIKENSTQYAMTTNTCGKSLLPGQSCTLTFVFTPLSAEKHEASIALKGNFMDTAITLVGQGIDPPAAQFGPRKWHPGHYAQLSNRVDLAAVKRIVPRLPPEIKGAMVPAIWSKIETAKGVYDFSELKSELNVLKAAGKRMVILFQDKSYDANRKECVPSYMRTDPIYEGGQFTPTDANSQGCETKRWVPAVMDRMIAAYMALGKTFDGLVWFEGISTEETATEAPDIRAYVDQLKRLASAMPKAFPRSLTNMWTNWRMDPYTGELIDHLYRNGVGFGGPDTIPTPHFTSQAYPYFPKYAGRTYSLMGVQPSKLIWKQDLISDGSVTLDEVFHFAVTDPQGINATHLFWWYFVDDKAPYDFSDTVDVIRANGSVINNMCPENLICDTQ